MYRLLLKLHQELQGKEGGLEARDIWLEFDSDLWEKHLPHLRKGIYGKGRTVFDPSTKHYGFQEDIEEGEVSENALEAALLQDAKENEKDMCKSLHIPEPLESASGAAMGNILEGSSSGDEEKTEEEDGVREDISRCDAASNQGGTDSTQDTNSEALIDSGN